MVVFKNRRNYALYDGRCCEAHGHDGSYTHTVKRYGRMNRHGHGPDRCGEAYIRMSDLGMTAGDLIFISIWPTDRSVTKKF